MEPNPLFQNKPPEFWALVKLVSQLLKYSTRKTRTTEAQIKEYAPDEIAASLVARGLDVNALAGEIDEVARYSQIRAILLNNVSSQLMDRTQAREQFLEIEARVNHPELVVWNKQRGEKQHQAYLTSIVNLLTHEVLSSKGRSFAHNPRGPLTFAQNGKPLRTLFRWMDGAYPDVNHPHATWEIKEYYGTRTFGSRVADGVYETALDGYELNELRVHGIEVAHYLFVDDRFTWWGLGKSYLCRIVDILHSGLVDAVFFGREAITEWPAVVDAWP